MSGIMSTKGWLVALKQAQIWAQKSKDIYSINMHVFVFFLPHCFTDAGRFANKVRGDAWMILIDNKKIVLATTFP